MDVKSIRRRLRSQNRSGAEGELQLEDELNDDVDVNRLNIKMADNKRKRHRIIQLLEDMKIKYNNILKKFLLSMY